VEGSRLDDHIAATFGAAALGFLSLFRGRLADARRFLLEADLHSQQDDFGAAMAVRATLAVVAHFSGDDEQAASWLERAEAAVVADEPPRLLAPYLIRARAWVMVGAGDASSAQRLVLDTAEQLADWPVLSGGLAYEAVRAGAAAGKALALVEAAAAGCDARSTNAFAADLRARSAGDWRAVVAASEQLEAIGWRAYATEAAMAAARGFLDEGRTDSARRAVARARALHARGQGGQTPVLDGLDGPAVGLTPRETQLVTLAARGLTNGEIADQLVLSVRTVESHLYRAMQKLGVSDRRELRDETLAD
jgi:ATP/maltotriose-dependent transcriptional regulator MalT